jgi:hypothetical protein
MSGLLYCTVADFAAMSQSREGVILGALMTRLLGVPLKKACMGVCTAWHQDPWHSGCTVPPPPCSYVSSCQSPGIFEQIRHLEKYIMII